MSNLPPHFCLISFQQPLHFSGVVCSIVTACELTPYVSDQRASSVNSVLDRASFFDDDDFNIPIPSDDIIPTAVPGQLDQPTHLAQ